MQPKPRNPLGGQLVKGEGCRYVLDGRHLSVLAAAWSTELTQDDTTELVDALDELLAGNEAEDAGTAELARSKPTQQFLSSPIFEPWSGETLYKFVSPEVYGAHYSHGRFRFGTLASYRPLEFTGNPAGDRLEGRAYCQLSSPDGDLTACVSAGYDAWIGSFTDTLAAREVMSERFGPVILRFDAQRFLQRAEQELNCPAPRLGVVSYSDLKIVKSSTIGGLEIDDLPYLGGPWIFDELYRIAAPTALFVKPSRFAVEREVRLAFASGDLLNQPRCIQFSDHHELWKRIA